LTIFNPKSLSSLRSARNGEVTQRIRLDVGVHLEIGDSVSDAARRGARLDAQR
jgi:hypothetical protein